MVHATTDFYHLVRKPTGHTVRAPVLFLFHGMGGNERDLSALGQKAPADWLVIAVRGPIKLGPDQFKWFDVKPADDWFDVPPADRKAIVDVASEQAVRRDVMQFIDRIVDTHDADPAQVVVAGFSQGASLSLNLFLTMQEKFKSVAAFGGRVMDEIKPQITQSDALHSKQIFLGFGSNDQFIPPEHAASTQSYLESLGCAVTTSLDDVGHSISAKHLDDFARFLQTLPDA